jgi:hypothetical protein
MMVAWCGAAENFRTSRPPRRCSSRSTAKEQLLTTSADGAHAFDPSTGKQYWQYLFPTKAGVNISTSGLVPRPDHLLFLSAAYDGGTHVLQLAQGGWAQRGEELWFSNKMRVHFGNVLRIGDYFYGSSGDFGPSF